MTAGYAFFCSFVYAGDAAGNFLLMDWHGAARGVEDFGGLRRQWSLFLVGAGGGVHQHTSNTLYLQRSSLMPSIPCTLLTCSSDVPCSRSSFGCTKRQTLLYFKAFSELSVPRDGCTLQSTRSVLWKVTWMTPMSTLKVWTEIGDCCTFGLGNPLQVGTLGACDCLCCHQSLRRGNDMESLMRSVSPIKGV